MIYSLQAIVYQNYSCATDAWRLTCFYLSLLKFSLNVGMILF